MQVQDYLKQAMAAGAALVIVEYVQKVNYYQNSLPQEHSGAIMMWSYVAILILAAASYWGMVEARKDLGGRIKFGQAFFVSIFVAFIASLLVGGFYFIYGKYIDPDEVNRMSKYWTEQMQSQKVDAKTIEERIAQLRLGYEGSSQFLLGMKYLIYGLFISLVVAAIGSRKRNVANTNAQP